MNEFETPQGMLTAKGLETVVRNLIPEPSNPGMAVRLAAHGIDPEEFKKFARTLAQRAPALPDQELMLTAAISLGFQFGLEVGYAQAESDHGS